jgi:type IV pilus modification protein PilV
MNNNRFKQPQSGFSLIEALISLAILSSGLFALAQFQSQMLAYGGQTKTQTAALSLAQQKLEELRMQAGFDYSRVVAGRDRPSPTAGDSAQFDRTWSVVSHSSPAYKDVKVTTTWTSADGTGQSVTIGSFLASTAPYIAGSGH